MGKITYEEFKKIFELMPYNSEYELYFKGTDRTYSLVKYKENVSVCRCGYSEEMIKMGFSADYQGTEEQYFNSFDELCMATVVDGLCIKKEWNSIETIVVNNAFCIPDDLNELKEVYKF